jgi:hypothetical protein
VTVALDHPLASFVPQAAIGAALDGHEEGETAQIYTPANIRAMRSAGLGAVSYRLRTELGVEAWHSSAGGEWSDPRCQCGYWTSSAKPTGGPLVATYGYRLPRRGDTIDQANDDGYSRIDDGSEATFWKSDPYLDATYTHDQLPQWVVVDLGRPRALDAARVDWGTPFATRFSAEYWVGPSALALASHPPGHWAEFPVGRLRGHAGRQVVRLARRPLLVRFVRLLLTRSSHTAPAGSTDIRDRLGFAVRELGIGRLAGGRFVDLVKHAPSQRQTIVYTSSTDPWHRASDIDRNYEQPSFQTLRSSGLLAGQPLLVPVPILYGTPANAVAELLYLRRLGVRLRGVELGEEPDGQLVTPEDYGALYLEFARAIHRVLPGLPLGGPSLQTSIPDWDAWPDEHGNRSWVSRFLAYLREHGGLAQLSFFSFEWYPFDDTCASPASQLVRNEPILARAVNEQRAHGLPASIQIYITEYGFSAFAGRAEVALPGALLNADTVGEFLSLGGSAAYLYGYEPDTLIEEQRDCNTWGNLALILSDGDHHIKHPLPTYWTARLLTQQWSEPGRQANVMLATNVAFAGDQDVPQRLGAYALRRPDRRIALLLVNKSSTATIAAHIESGASSFDVYQYSSAQYAWHADGPNGYPKPDLPPAHTTLAGDTVNLPPYSVTVLRTRAGA